MIKLTDFQQIKERGHITFDVGNTLTSSNKDDFESTI